jgi:hypothetical protein
MRRGHRVAGIAIVIAMSAILTILADGAIQLTINGRAP